jgi:hypothetical protein
MLDSSKLEDFIKRLEEIEGDLTESQGGELKMLLDSFKKKKESPLTREEERGMPPLTKKPGSREQLTDLPGELDKPKGISIEKVSVLEKPKDENYNKKVDEAIRDQDRKPSERPEITPSKGILGGEELTDEELEELLRHRRSMRM